MFALILQDPLDERLVPCLKDVGFASQAVSTPEQADAVLSSRPVDTLVADYDFPNALGFFERQQGQSILVCVSQHGERQSIERAVAAGIHEWISLDCTVETLRQRMVTVAAKNVRQAFRMYRLFENAPDLSWVIDSSGYVTYASASFMKRTGYGRAEVIGRHFTEFIEPGDQDYCRRIHDRILRGERAPVFAILLRRRNGPPLPVEIVSSAPRVPSFQGIHWILRDISRRVELEESLSRRVATQDLIALISRRLFNASPEEFAQAVNDCLHELCSFSGADDCFCRIDLDRLAGAKYAGRPDPIYAWTAPQFREGIAVGRSLTPADFPWLLKRTFSRQSTFVMRPDQLPAEAQPDRLNLERMGITSHLDAPILRAGEVVGVIVLNAIGREAVWGGHIMGALRTIGEIIAGAELRNLTLRELARSEELYRVLVENATVGVIMSCEERFIYANPAMQKMLGYSREELESKYIHDFLPDTPRGRKFVMERYHDRLAGKPVPSHYEIQIQGKDGAVLDILAASERIEWEGNVGVVAMLQDITELKRTERELQRIRANLETRVIQRTQDLYRMNEQLQSEVIERTLAERRLRDSLEEKEALLREVNHRVKNNLQIILSLLHLQEDYMREPVAERMISDIRNRIHCMGLVHEILCQSHSLSAIDVSNYIQTLALNLLYSYRGDSDDIEMAMEDTGVWLSIDTAIALGLIVNELVSNALKHAFPNGRGGKVSISLSHEGDSRLALKVADNGVGLPRDFDINRAESLGLQLVQALAHQLDGTIEFSRSGGTEFLVRFASCKE